MKLLPAFVGMPERNRVYNVDALTLLKAMPAGSVDCIVTDPPYGINKAVWDGAFPTDWISEAWRVSKRLIVMTGIGEINLVANAVGNYKFCVAVCSRNGMTRSSVAFGNWFPALLFGEWTYRQVPSYIPYNVSTTEHIDHPSPKPLQAMRKLLQYYTDPNWLIVDPFGGSGTTALAARELERDYITCDVSLPYTEIARKRLALPFTPLLFAELAG
jgi:DNA modification methylase